MDYASILKTLEKYFCDLLIIQYRNAETNRAMIKQLVNLVFANNLALQIQDLCVDVEKSIGAQLDVVGKWVGIDRYYTGFTLWDKKYFSLPSYKNIKENSYTPYMGGFSNYSNFNSLKGAFLTYKTYRNTITRRNAMGDEFFRRLIKLKIIINSMRLTRKKIDEAIYNWSEGAVYTTWDKMQLTYNYPEGYKNLMELAIYKKVLPAPCGTTVILKEI